MPWPRHAAFPVALPVNPSGPLAVLRYPSLCLLLLTLAPASAAPSGSASYQLPRQSLDGGAVTARGGDFTLTGAIGQPDASVPAVGGTFTLSGGFHRQTGADLLFRDGFESP